MFDESYNIREVLDDVIERVNMRERLISTARQFNDKKREERYNLALKQFDNLMQDFLHLYHPILDRLRNYRETLQKELQGLKTGLATILGMLETSQQIEGLAAKTEQLQADQQDLEKTIKEKSETQGKIDSLLNRIQPYLTGASSPDQLGDVLSNMPKDLFPEMPAEPTKTGSKRR